MLTTGFNHVAVLTNDTERLTEFYTSVFDAEVLTTGPGPEGVDPDEVRLTIIQIGPTAELNVFQIRDNHEADRQVPMFGRGRLDHLALQAASLEAFENRHHPRQLPHPPGVEPIGQAIEIDRLHPLDAGQRDVARVTRGGHQVDDDSWVGLAREVVPFDVARRAENLLQG